MASGSGLATALAALKAHAVAATVVGALVVGGGAATVAVTTGTVQVPGVNIHAQTTKTDTDASATPRAAACANNGDATRLAGIFSPMFGGDKTVAQSDICTLFVGTNGHALGLGEVQQALEITAAIEKSGSNACLTATADHGQSATNGKPSTAGTPASGTGNSNDKGSQGNSQTTFTAPQESATTTMGIVQKVLGAAQQGTPLAQLAKNCDAVAATGNSGNTTDNGNTGNNGNSGNGDNGNGHPNGTPTAKPTGTPGHGHP